MSGLVLHGYWRSSAAYRVRIALNLKGIGFDQVMHDLRAGAQRDPAYLRIAPHGLVPALEQGEQVVIESPAILEWIEAKWPAPALMPQDIDDAAVVRAMAAIICCDIHPLGNLRVLKALRADFGASVDQANAWAARWIAEGFGALETLVARHGGAFAFGDSPTVADCCLVPQIYNADRFGVDLTPFPRLTAAASTARALLAVAAAHPDRQPGAEGA